jgi:hypothetical protein
MNRIINWLLLIIIFVFDPLAIALVIAANFAFNQLRSKEGYDMYKDIPLEEQIEDMKKVVNTYDALNELTKIQEEAGLYDNEGSDIYTEDDLKEWDTTLMDGLEEEPEIEVKMSGEPSLDAIQEEIHSEEKLLNNPGISAWRKKKIRDYLDGKTKSYW